MLGHLGCVVGRVSQVCLGSLVQIVISDSNSFLLVGKVVKENGDYNIKAIMDDSFQLAQKCFPEVDGEPDKEAVSGIVNNS